MPLTNPVVIGGAVVGAYVDEGFLIDGQDGLISLLELLQYILNIVNSSDTLSADNGLLITENQIRLGGNLIEDTLIDNQTFFLKFGKDALNNKAYFLQDSTQRQFLIVNESADFAGTNIMSPDSFSAQVLDKNTDALGALGIGSEQCSLGIGTEGSPFATGFFARPDQISLQGVRSYASTVAAQADGTLDEGGLYTLTGDSVLRIKLPS
ncbi:hypothetical protein [Haliscomenobacter hydrossis]|uniref:Uncharacterized protein n=1 Tax=Haliscomenobacter hydrossis (strain ATCC 27775 / DSM 1100 / LMG 10767 / O) TaxID=760192 RepID=F4KZ72_HALH1|nr:hypothetical protein [Haliscomenobacter hydrossis]AEE53726.1 hypothetical protein Halhy_5903 [Haliscomenobacter hydrossis DSM 1100]